MSLQSVQARLIELEETGEYTREACLELLEHAVQLMREVNLVIGDLALADCCENILSEPECTKSEKPSTMKPLLLKIPRTLAPTRAEGVHSMTNKEDDMLRH